MDEIKQFFSSNKSWKNKSKDFLQLYKQITDYKKTNKQRSEKLNEPILRFVQYSCELANHPELAPIWHSLIDVTSEILNSYGSFHSNNESQIFDVFFKPLLQEIHLDEHSDLYKFLERLLAKTNLGFRLAMSEFFRKLFLEAFASNVKRKLKESYDLFRIVHIHIPEIISPILTMHQGFLKNPNPELREIGIRFFVDVLIGNYTVKEELPLDEFRQSFHEKDSEAQRLVIENLAKYLLRKSDITNVLIDDFKQCFEGTNLSPSLLHTLVEQIGQAIKECYHATPSALLDLLFLACDHSTPSVAIEALETIAYLYRVYYVKDPYPSPSRSRLDIVPRLVLHAAIKHPDLIVRVEAQTKFFENIIFEHYRIDERTRQFFIFAQSNLGDEGIKHYGQLLHIQSELRSLIHQALLKCSSMNEKSVTRMSTSVEDVTPDLEDDEDEETLNEILQKLSDLCFAPKERGVRHLRQWLVKSEPRAKEYLQSSDQSSSTLMQTMQDTTIDEGTEFVENRLASRVSIVFSHEFLEEFPSAAQEYFNEEAELLNDEDDEEDPMMKEQHQYRCIKQMGKLTKVLRVHWENFLDVEILEKFIGVIDENRPILSTFVFGLLAEFGALLGPGPIKTSLITRLVDIVVDSLKKGDRTTMGKWAMRALVPIVSSNEKQFEHLIIHDLFGKTKTSWWNNDGPAAANRWLLLSHIVRHAPSTRTMFEVLQQILQVLLRQFPQMKSASKSMKSFEEIPDEIQMKANQLKFLSRSAHSIRIQHYRASLLESSGDDDEEERGQMIETILKFLLKLLKDVFIFADEEIARHFLQLQGAMEILRMLEIPEIFHRFAPIHYVDLFSAATHQNRDVRHRFLQRVLQKVSQFKISVLFLGLTIAVPNDDEDLITGKALKSVMERLYLLASKGSVETMQRLLPEKSISLMIYLHANNRSLIVQIDRDVIESIANSVKWSLKTMLQAREKTEKHFHGAIPKLLHSIKHSRCKSDPNDVELHQRIYLIVDIFQSIFADLSPLEAYDFADARNNLSGEPLLFTAPNFNPLNTKSYLPEFYKEKKVTKRSKKDPLNEIENETMISSSETSLEILEENEKKSQKRKVAQSTRSRKRRSN